MSKCPFCDTENQPGAKTCEFCGSDMPETKICKSCGAEIDKNASFCPSCKKLADVDPAASTSANSDMTAYQVTLADVGNDKPQVIKEVIELCGVDFDGACSLIDSGVILAAAPKLQAEIAVSKLRNAGASASMQAVDSGTYSAPRQSAPTQIAPSNSAFDKPLYGTLAVIFSVLGGWIGLLLSILGLLKSNNPVVRKRCKIGLIILACWVGFVVLLAILGGVVGGGAVGGDAERVLRFSVL